VACASSQLRPSSYLDPHVKVLRGFRDRWLLTNKSGRAFVAFYYKHSPRIADFIATHSALRLATRLGLTPIVYALAYPLPFLGPIAFCSGLTGQTLIRRKKKAK
jgi:hypothetical protein